MASVAVVLVAVVLVWTQRRSHRPDDPAGVPAGYPPLPHKVTAEVLNTTTSPGVARAVTVALRSAGIDVVYFGNADDSLRGRAHSAIRVRGGDTTGVGRVVAALGRADVADARDPTLLVDLTVLIGADYVAPRAVPRR